MNVPAVLTKDRQTLSRRSLEGARCPRDRRRAVCPSAAEIMASRRRELGLVDPEPATVLEPSKVSGPIAKRHTAAQHFAGATDLAPSYPTSPFAASRGDDVSMAGLPESFWELGFHAALLAAVATFHWWWLF